MGAGTVADQVLPAHKRMNATLVASHRRRVRHRDAVEVESEGRMGMVVLERVMTHARHFRLLSSQNYSEKSEG
jgi:hypothetical protein